MLTISLDDTLAARLEAVLPKTKIADANTFAVAVITDALTRLEQEPMSILEAQTEGVKSLTQFFDEQKTKHGFPDDWGKNDVVLTSEDWARIDAAFAETK